MKEGYYLLNEILRELEESLHERSRITKNMKKHIIKLIKGAEKDNEIQYKLIGYLELLRKNRNTILTCLRKTGKVLNTINEGDINNPNDIKHILSLIHTLLSYAIMVDFENDRKILYKLITISKNSNKYSILTENINDIRKDYTELKGLWRETEKLIREIEMLIDNL
ncbi:MAG TPA: hypothetical protein EYH40_01995 [Desulfurococcales archaeon]|nr:hypothetical protein [Desulfurococcales archaeon]